MLLTDQGQEKLGEIAKRHGFSPDAAEVMLAALLRGNGRQAQFDQPEFGGMGQWSSGGMVMIGDMFNNALKSRVSDLANDLSGLVGSSELFRPQDAAGGVSPISPWPADLGAPSSSGAQNDLQYAVFPAHRRLAVMQGGRLSVYDTGDHLIGGVSQQQGGGSSLQFTSQHGPVSLDSLTPVDGAAAPNAEAAAPATTTDDSSVFATIEQLHGLFKRGILSEAEFETKKAELLSRL